MITKTWNHLGLGIALAAAFAAQACRSKLDVKSKEGSPEPAIDAPPVDNPPVEEPAVDGTDPKGEPTPVET
jgi:hypothetical protein